MNHNLDICYIVSHGFAARMIMQTGLLARLVESGLRVGLISPDRSDENLVAFCQAHNVTLFEYNLSNKFWSENYWVKRQYMLEDIEANPVLWSKHLKAINFRSNKSKHPWRHIRPRIYYRLYRRAQKNPKYRAVFKAKEAEILDNEKARNFITTVVQPKVLVSTYPANLQEAILLHEANKNPAIKTVMHLLSWDNITSKGHFPALADEYIAWGDIMKAELQEYYNIAVHQIHVCGVPHFDEHIKAKTNPDVKYVQALELDPNKPYLFFAMSSPYFAPREIDIVEWLAERVEQGIYGKDLQLIVRPHPQNMQGHMADQSWLPRLKKLSSEKVAVDYPQLVASKLMWSMKRTDMQKFSQLLANCTISLNSGSTVSIDALMVDKPAIFTAFDGSDDLPYWDSVRRLKDYIHIKKLTDLGGISVANNYEELDQFIHTYLDNQDWKAQERQVTKLKQVGFDDGQSTSRVAAILKQVVNNLAYA